MLRHKALIQAARYAFGLGGIYDPDEGERIKEMIDITPKSKTANAHALPVIIKESFKPSEPKQTDIAEHIVDVNDMLQDEEPLVQTNNNDEVAELAFKRVSDGVKSMINAKGVNTFFEYSSKEDLDYLKVNKPEYFAELISLRNQCLERLK